MYTDTQTNSQTSDAAEHNDGHKHRIEDDYNIHDASFRRHYQLNYANEPLEYESFFAPAYRFGYELSAENPHAEWDEVEEQAHTEWVANHPVSWASVIDAVRYGWEEERNPNKNRVEHSRRSTR